MTPTLKRKLLARINAGMDTDSAAAELGIPVSEITNCTKAFTAKLDEAVRAGSARLRGRLFKNALRDDDAKFLQEILDRRSHAAANQPVTAIHRLVIDSPCQVCGHTYKPVVKPKDIPIEPTDETIH